MTDVTHEISTVRRTVGDRTLEAGAARVVAVSRVYPVGIDDLWDACTDADRIGRWFAPVSGDLRLGGRYQLEGNAGGVIERCDPPGTADEPGFAATWEFGDQIGGIEVRLTPAPDGTRFTVEHSGHVDDAFWEQFGPGAVGVGWELGLLGLALHLGGEGRYADDWTTTGDGRRFATASAQGWGAAHVAAGADPQAAREAADRTAAFYTGAPGDPGGSDAAGA